MSAWALGVALAAVAGLSDVAGSALVLTSQRRLGRWFGYLVAYGTGFALGIALGQLLPDGLEGGSQNGLWALAGFSLLFLTNRLLRDTRGSEGAAAGSVGVAVAGVAVCDFFDGVTVASATLASTSSAGAPGAAATGAAAGVPAGWLLVAGLFPHNFLEGATFALLMLGAGLPRGLVWLVVALFAAASLAGGFAVVVAVAAPLRQAVQAFAGGLLLHLVATERLAEIRGGQARLQAVAVVAGAATFAAVHALL